MKQWHFPALPCGLDKRVHRSDSRRNSGMDLVTGIRNPIIVLTPTLSIRDINTAASVLFDQRKEILLNTPFSDLNLGTQLTHLLEEIISDSPSSAVLDAVLVTHRDHQTISWSILPSYDTQGLYGLILLGHPMATHEAFTTPSQQVIALSNELTGQRLSGRKSTIDYINHIYRYMETLIAKIPSSVYWMNRHGIYLGCNDNMAKLFHLKNREEIIGQTYEDLYDPKSAAAYRKADTEVMETGRSITLEEPLYYPDGHQEVYLSSKVPLLNDKKEVIGILGISTDITERKALEEKLRVTQTRESRFKAIAALGSMVAHEMRTPLASLNASVHGIQYYLPKLIAGYEKSLDDGTVQPIPKDRLMALKKSVGYMDQSVRHIQGTIRFILTDLSETEQTNILSQNLNTFSLKSAIDEALDMYHFDIGQEKLITVKHIDDVAVLGDYQVFIHILHNLLNNALHFIAAVQQGCITLWSRQEKGLMHLYFKDTAKGIPRDELPHIFDAFYTTKEKSAGSIGMGLYFCKTVLNRMGGSMTCKSVYGKYTCFEIVLKTQNRRH